MHYIQYIEKFSFCVYRGSAEATRQAHALITALITDPDKELNEIIPKAKQKPPPVDNKSMYFIPPGESPSPVPGNSTQVSGNPQPKSSTKTLAPRLQQQVTMTTGNTARLGIVGQSNPNVNMVWGGSQAVPGSLSPRRNTGKVAVPAGAPYSVPTASMNGPITADKSNVTRQLFTGIERRSGGFGSPNSVTTIVTMSNVSSPIPASPPSFNIRPDGRPIVSRANIQGNLVPGTVKLLQRPLASTKGKHDQQPLPIIPNQVTTAMTTLTVTSANISLNLSSSGEFSPFNNLFSNNADQLLGKKDDNLNERMNFASVAAAGVVSSFSGSSIMSLEPNSPDPALQAKAPGFKLQPNVGPRMMAPQDLNPGFRAGGFPLPPQMMDLMHGGLQGFAGYQPPPAVPQPFPNQSPNMSPRSSQSSTAGLSPRSNSSGFDPQLVGSQKEEYTTADQPMTLPKISSSLNPNAPDFTSRSVPGGSPFPGPGGGQSFPKNSAFPPQMYNQQELAQLMSVLNMGSGQVNLPGPPSSQAPDPLSGMSSNPQEFLNNMASLVQYAQGFNPSGVPRSFSPLPAQGRPSSAPSVGGMLPQGM